MCAGARRSEFPFELGTGPNVDSATKKSFRTRPRPTGRTACANPRASSKRSSAVREPRGAGQGTQPPDARAQALGRDIEHPGDAIHDDSRAPPALREDHGLTVLGGDRARRVLEHGKKTAGR